MINLIKSLDLRLIGAAFGAFLLALSLYYLLFAGRASLRPTRGVVLACSAVGIVFILLGRAVGMRLVRQLNAEVIKRAIYLFVSISDAMTLIENIR